MLPDSGYQLIREGDRERKGEKEGTKRDENGISPYSLLHSSYTLLRVTSLNPGDVVGDVGRVVVSARPRPAAIGCHNRCNVIRRHFNRNINSSRAGRQRLTRVRSRRVATTITTLSSLSLIDFCDRLDGQFVRKLRVFRMADRILRDTGASLSAFSFYRATTHDRAYNGARKIATILHAEFYNDGFFFI